MRVDRQASSEKSITVLPYYKAHGCKASPVIWPILRWAHLRPFKAIMLGYKDIPRLYGQFSFDKTVGLVSGKHCNDFDEALIFLVHPRSSCGGPFSTHSLDNLSLPSPEAFSFLLSCPPTVRCCGPSPSVRWPPHDTVPI